MSDTRGLAYVQDDPILKRGYLFKRAMTKRHGPSIDYPEMMSAYQYYMGTLVTRGMLEGYLLTGAENERIAQSFCCRPEVIAAYHDLFFDVRPRLEAFAWINSAVFGDVAYTGVAKYDRHGMLQRIAWLGGVDLYESLLSPRSKVKDVAEVYREVIERALVQNSLETAISTGNNPEVAYQLLTTTVEKLTPKDDGQSADDEYQEAVTAFVQSVGISVADPTQDANLKLPARELRESEYEVHS